MRYYLLIIFICTQAFADFTVGEMPKELHAQTKCLNHKFLISKSKNTKPQALFIFLHGIGKRGKEINNLKSMAKLIHKNTSKYNMLTVLPQCSWADKGKGWWDSNDLDLLLKHIKNSYKVDSNRIYLSGFSMGGFGVWDWAMASPDTFAAIAPISGGSKNPQVSKIKDLNIWAFHGEKDKTVKFEKSKVLVDELLKLKAENVIFTTYPDKAHDIVMPVMKSAELYKWFSEQSKIINI
ncbi:dienelactone hydrolase family protein [Lentisphaera marina]|uniref:carboxylesterase family protein n=1 Tax=Lentisphaera marina TaxID=1111041 RepID=UPI0023667AF8|nr:dienelactone hydrolase family protein [Lentisphaera marina]MDD7984619.1 dienelactone hydrolase family protein [Lentisphaera marina]